MSEFRIVKPTESELEILQILWEFGPSTVKSVNERLNNRRIVGYTTTLKLLQIMHEKGIVKRNEAERSHVYSALVTESNMQKIMVERVMDLVFSGSASKLVLHALGNSRPSKEELIKIKELLEQIERSQK